MAKQISNQSAEQFNLSPAAVKKWIEELPLGSTGETSKQVYQTLKKVNKHSHDLSKHIEFLEAIAPTISLLYPRLSQYFADSALPHGTRTRNVIHVTNLLLKEVLHGYQLIFKKLVTKKPFGWKKPFSLALHHSLIYASQILHTQQLSYHSHTKGIWEKIFWCYQQAENLKLLNKSFFDFAETPSKTTIEHEFKKLILLSLLDSHNLSTDQMQEIHGLMPLWIKYSEILTQEPNDKESCFSLNIHSDTPPYLISINKTQGLSETRYFSNAKLKTYLTNCLSKLDKNNSIKIGKQTLSKSTILSLLADWARCHIRENVRQEGKGFVDIVTGITAIHFVLSQQDQPAHDDAADDLIAEPINHESTLTIEPVTSPGNQESLSLSNFLGASEQEEDVWGKVFETTINEPLPVADWTESGMFKVFKFTKSILLDYSDDGYRLSVNVKKIDSLKHNELVAVREHALAPWALAQVKWLHFSEMGDIQFGLRILTHHVLPISIRYSANNILSKPLPCLLGLSQQKIILFSPTLPADLAGKKLDIEHQTQHSKIIIENKIFSTAAFDAYKILETKNMQAKANNSLAEKKTKLIIDNTISHTTDTVWDNF